MEGSGNMSDSRDFMLKLQQLATTALTLWMLSPHELSENENTYLANAAGALENAIPLLSSAGRDHPEPEENT